jgi:uncharacterized protein (TIGR02001 family)
MKLIRGGALVIGLLGVATATQAGVTSTWTAVSDYDFRGITQSAKDPAIQASVDYAHDSGFYIGLWGSNVEFGPGDPNVEGDLYAGFTKTLDSGFSYDVGGVYYTYYTDPNPSLNYFEIYGGVGFTTKSGLSIKGKLFYSPDFGGDFTPGDTEAQYLSGDLSVPLPSGFSASAHVGYSFGTYWKDGFFNGEDAEYFDYAVGVGYAAGKFNLALKYIDGSDAKDFGTDTFSTDGKVVFSVATTFPWGE